MTYCHPAKQGEGDWKRLYICRMGSQDDIWCWKIDFLTTGLTDSQKNMSNCQKWLLTTACFVHVWGNKTANYTGMDGIRILLKRHTDWDGRWNRFLMNYASFHFCLYTSPMLTFTVELLYPLWINSAPFVIFFHLIHKPLLQGICLPYECKWAEVLEGLHCITVPFLCNQCCLWRAMKEETL